MPNVRDDDEESLDFADESEWMDEEEEEGEPGMIAVTVTDEDLLTAENQGSVIVVTGTAENGSRITFAGDHGPMVSFLNSVTAQGKTDTFIEPWQILRTEKPEN